MLGVTGPARPRQRSFAERVPSVRPCRSSSQLIQTGGYNEHMKTRWTAVLSAVFAVSLTDGLPAQAKHRGPVCPSAPPPAPFTGIGHLARPDCRRLFPPLLRHHRRNTPRRRFSLGVRAPLPDGLHPRGLHPLRRGGDLFQLPQHARPSSSAGNDAGRCAGTARNGALRGPAELSAEIICHLERLRQEERCRSGS